MFDPQPGPLSRLDVDSLRPFPSRVSFEGIVAGALDELPALDAVLSNAAVATVDNPSVDLDGVFASTIGGASNEVAWQLATAPGSPAPQLVANGDNAGGIRQDSARYLPSSDAPIVANLENPPSPPGALQGGRYYDSNLPHPNPN